MTDDAAEPVFVYETEIATTPHRLWEALTTGDLSRRYWFDRRIESDWQVGSAVHFYDGDSDTITDSGEVLECNTGRRLVYTFQQVAEGEADLSSAPTRVAFDLTPLADDRVRLRLVHDRLADPGDVEGWRQGWTPILANLEALLEGREVRTQPPAG